MKTKYFDLIDQTYSFPQEEFNLTNNDLIFDGLRVMDLVETYGAPLKFTYLNRISDNISACRQWVRDAMEKHNYLGDYEYCYCTKSSHFKFVLDEVLNQGVHLETSSAFDIEIIKSLIASGEFPDGTKVICNGFKSEAYLHGIADLINLGVDCTPILDNANEIDILYELVKGTFNVGIRIASEEEPKFTFYTSRLGIGYKDILPLYEEKLRDKERVNVKMLHFFVNTGINDTAYYWNELNKCLTVYKNLVKVCPALTDLNIGGGFPIKNSLAFDFDYAGIINQIIGSIKTVATEEGFTDPNIFTEFGSFTVGEGGGVVFEIIAQKRQNDREKWNMINGSFMTAIPDTWALNQRFIMLPLNRWNENYERVLLGGQTCDSDDFYNSEQHMNAIYLPNFSHEQPLYIGFFNTGAYQESVGGYGGISHCLMPNLKHVLIRREEDGTFSHKLFKEEQKPSDVLDILGY